MDHYALDAFVQHGIVLGPKIEYVCVRTYNMYSGEPVTVVLAKARLGAI